MSDTAESTAPQGSMQEATDKLKALREPEPQQEATQETEETQAIENTDEVAETKDETTETQANETETQEVEQEAPEDTTDSIELDADQFSQLLHIENDKLIVDDDNQIKFKTKVDGEQGEATLEQLIKSYQTEASNNNKSMNLAESKKQQQELFDQSNQHIQQQSQYAATVLESINQNFLNEVNQADLDQLRIDDPAEYSAKQIEFNQKREQIQNLASQSLQILEDQNRAKEAEQQRLIGERIPIEAQAMKDKFKSMNIDVNETLQNDITTYLVNQNYSNDEINNNLDHRFMVMAYKAKMFDQGIKNLTQKQVKKKLPKVLKTGQKPSQKAVDTAKLNKAVAQAKKSGSMDDAIARLKATRT